jgi:hypothetical protein
VRNFLLPVVTSPTSARRPTPPNQRTSTQVNQDTRLLTSQRPSSAPVFILYPTFPSPSRTMSTSTNTPTQPVYFWRPKQGNGYLSQWYYSPFTVDGENYATAEMWMMVQKARLFGDEAIASQMLATTDPALHKKLGRLVKGFDERVWDERMYSTLRWGEF